MQKFLLDGMLGKLARWLRILGYDTLYRYDAEDENLLKVAAGEKRVLITRDHDLHRRAIMNNLQSILLMNGKPADWLAYLEEKADVRLRLEEHEPRCSLCNSSLESVNRNEIDGQVPRDVLFRRDEFWRCPGCRKIYWQGSHWENMREVLSEIERKSGGR